MKFLERSVFYDKDGYPKIKLNSKARFVHRLVWASHNGEIPKGLTINHIDGDKLNWGISNLETLTQGDNVRHAWNSGLCSPNIGEKHGRSILNDMVILTIRTLPSKAKNGRGYGFSGKELAQRYGVSPKVLREARSGKTWKHLPL